MPKRVDVNQFRRGEITIEDLNDFAEKAKSLQSDLAAIIESMKKLRLKSIHVDGIKKIPQAIGIFQHGIRNIRKGIVDAS